MSNKEDASKHESILIAKYHEIREAWHRTPFLHRVLSFTMIVFALLLVCYVILLADDAQSYSEQQSLKYYPRLEGLLSDITEAISVEGEVSAKFAKSKTAVNWATLVAVRQNVDYLQHAVADFFGLHNTEVVLDAAHPILQGTRLSEIGIGSTFNARSQITQGQIILPVQGVRSSYTNINARVLQQLSKTAATLNSRNSVEPTIKAVGIAAIGWHLANAIQAVNSFSTSSGNASARQTALSGFAQNANFVNALASYLLLPIQREHDRQLLGMLLSASQLRLRYHDLLIAVSANGVYNTSASVSTNSTFDAARLLLTRLKGSTLRETKSVSNTFYVRSFVMAALALVAVVAALAQWIIVESLNAERNAIRIRNAHVMHDVLVRVGELVDSMASFSLDPPPPPRSMMGTRVGVLELRLQHCLASLKTLAPTLPPLLFPRRLSELAAEYSEVKDPATMQFTKKPRESLLKEPLQQVTKEDILNNRHSAVMHELTKLQVRETEAAFLFVDLSFFHDLGTVEKMQFASETFREVSAMIEECVYQFKGVLHSISFDRAVGVWNIASKAPNFCEQAATCGLVLSNRLTSLRRHNKHLREYFQVRIGVVAGPVRQGIFGDQKAKYLELLGEPLEKGIKVARANSFHMTTVACDETVRRAVDKIYLAKPIELLDDGACIYEVIHEGSRREADLETQLLVYSKAFELFERKYYREALRAFRAYTKLYGYDSSVERIQQLITGINSLE